MYLSSEILGATITRELAAREANAVLKIGSDQLTRADLARVHCYNFLAAARLSALLDEHLQVKNLKEVFEKVPPEALALPHLGTISLAVLGAAFEAKGIGGERPLENYVKRHQANGVTGFVTFDTIKRHTLTRTKRRSWRRPR